VVLCDRSRFPRDKACGDGLIADSIGALRTLGLETEVRARARAASRLRVFSPGGVEMTFESEFLVIPRAVFDAMLVERAIAAGATFEQAIVERPHVEQDRVAGVVVRVNGQERTWRAPLTVLATGGAAAVLRKFDSLARAEPSGLAVRTYARQTSGPPLSELMISLERDLLPGYAWAFPAPDGLLNVGVGIIGGDAAAQPEVNLRARLDALLAGAGFIGAAIGPLRDAARYRGAPLRTGLTGSSFSRPGLAIIGEAAGTTYAVSGEGIGKAMESGMLLAEIVASGVPLHQAGARYASLLTFRYGSRFRAYATAERWIARPFIADYVARRANQSRWVHDRLTGIITERALPDRVFSARSIWRLMTRR
jgi:flavin-dependent dehydrogenase